MVLWSIGLAHAQTVSMEGVDVAVLGAASDPAFHEDVVNQLMCASRGIGPFVVSQALPRPAYELARVEVFDVGSAVPALAEVEAFDVLLVWNDAPFVDADAVGDVVASALELGKGVVLMGNAVEQGMGLRGRFETQAMSPVEYGTAAAPGGNLEVVALDPADEWRSGPTIGHMTEWGVTTVDGGLASRR